MSSLYCCRGSLEDKRNCVKERQENELLSIFVVMSCSTALCLMGWVSTVFAQSHAVQGSALFSPFLPSSRRIQCVSIIILFTYECFQVYHMRSRE